MLTDAFLSEGERFSFLPRRLHAFETTGNAYDATQCDEQIKSGDTLIILSERVVGVAYTWPFAVTAGFGKLHSLAPLVADTLPGVAGRFSLQAEDIAFAITMAQALGFDLDPAILALCAPTA